MAMGDMQRGDRDRRRMGIYERYESGPSSTNYRYGRDRDLQRPPMQGMQRQGAGRSPYRSGQDMERPDVRRRMAQPDRMQRAGSGNGRQPQRRPEYSRQPMTRRTSERARRQSRRRIILQRRRQRAVIYSIAAAFLVLFVVFMIFKGVTGVASYIENSRAGQRGEVETVLETAVMDEIIIENAYAGEPAEASSEEAPETETETEAEDPTKVLSGGRYVDTTKPMVALTFDDGPDSRIGDPLMDELEKVDGRATFFVVGNRVAEFSDEVKRMVENGHEIANHSWDHDIHLKNNTADYVRQEFSKTDEAVLQYTGVEPALIRLPGGNISDTVRSVVQKPMIYWSIDTEDWRTKNAQSTISSVLDHVKDGDIVLMHELYSATLEACQTIIPELVKRGYQLVTVSELIRFHEADVQGGNGKQYEWFPPVVKETETEPPTESETAETGVVTLMEEGDGGENAGSQLPDTGVSDSRGNSSDNSGASSGTASAASSGSGSKDARQSGDGSAAQSDSDSAASNPGNSDNVPSDSGSAASNPGNSDNAPSDSGISSSDAGDTSSEASSSGNVSGGGASGGSAVLENALPPQSGNTSMQQGGAGATSQWEPETISAASSGLSEAVEIGGPGFGLSAGAVNPDRDIMTDFKIVTDGNVVSVESLH